MIFNARTTDDQSVTSVAMKLKRKIQEDKLNMGRISFLNKMEKFMQQL